MARIMCHGSKTLVPGHCFQQLLSNEHIMYTYITRENSSHHQEISDNEESSTNHIMPFKFWYVITANEQPSHCFHANPEVPEARTESPEGSVAKACIGQ